MIIAVDFDGTLVEHALEYLKKFQAAGVKLILWTMRGDSKRQGPTLTDAVEYCRKNGVTFWGVNTKALIAAWLEIKATVMQICNPGPIPALPAPRITALNEMLGLKPEKV